MGWDSFGQVFWIFYLLRTTEMPWSRDSIVWGRRSLSVRDDFINACPLSQHLSSDCYVIFSGHKASKQASQTKMKSFPLSRGPHETRTLLLGPSPPDMTTLVDGPFPLALPTYLSNSSCLSTSLLTSCEAQQVAYRNVRDGESRRI